MMEYGNLKILLVDDDCDDAEMIIYALQKLKSIQIQHIDDSVQALRYLSDPSTECPSLILLDLKMPKVDGIDILRHLSSCKHKSQVPVAVLISSRSGMQYVESFGLRPHAYLHKPVTSAEFLKVLTQIGLRNFNVAAGEVQNTSLG